MFYSMILIAYYLSNISIHDLLNPTVGPEIQIETIDNTLKHKQNLLEHFNIPQDPRFVQSMQEAYKRRPAKGEVDSFNIVDVPANNNFVPNRYVLCIEKPGTETEHPKARWIPQSHNDRYCL